MSKFYKNLSVGDFVIVKYNGWRIAKVVTVTRRFADKDYAKLVPELKVGDEYSAIVEVQNVYSSNFESIKTKKTQMYDAEYLEKIDFQTIVREKQRVNSCWDSIWWQIQSKAKETGYVECNDCDSTGEVEYHGSHSYFSACPTCKGTKLRKKTK